MSLADRRWLRMFTLCVLAFAQGLPWGFMASTIPSLLGKHVDPGVNGTLLAMTTLPYAFKWIWGPIIDAFTIRRFGRRRPWLVFAQAMMTITVAAMLALGDLATSLSALAWMIFIHTIFNSMQNVALDGLAIDLLDPAERGRANGFMYAAKYGGGIAGGRGIASLIERTDLHTAIVAQVIVLGAITLVPLLVREHDREPVREPSAITRWVRDFARGPRKVLAATFERAGRPAIRSAAACMALMFVYSLAISVLGAVGPTLFEQSLGWDTTAYAKLVGGPGLLAGFAGSIFGGVLADKVGHRRLAAIAGTALAACWFAWAALSAHWMDHRLVYALVVAEPVCTGVLTVSLFAVCMDVSWSNIAATQFAVYTSLASAAATLAFRHAGDVSTAFTYPHLYVACAIFQIVVMALLLLIAPRPRTPA